MKKANIKNEKLTKTLSNELEELSKHGTQILDEIDSYLD